VLNDLDVADSRAVFEAIRLAKPAGLGHVRDQDVAAEPTRPLKEIMALAAERDLVAKQYANDFHEVLMEGVPALRRGMKICGNLEDAIIAAHLELMAHHPDSLIARKCGVAEAEEAGRRAASVLAAGWPDTPAGQGAFRELDAWLRAVGHARNPGTSADLVAASLFAALRQGIITLPPPLPWSSPKASTRALGITAPGTKDAP
jgi:triphosphoribosyl-dephospho-CoA synthase